MLSVNITREGDGHTHSQVPLQAASCASEPIPEVTYALAAAIR